MTIATPRLEIFVDITGVNSDFFELDSDTLGLLDGDAVLAGPQWFDITDRATQISTSRGRSNIFGFNSAGQLSATLNNHDRAFDPIWTGSKLYGAVVPTIPVRLYLDDILAFTGTIEDWDLSYTPSFDNMASFTALDAFSDWAKLVLQEYSPAPNNPTSLAIEEALTEVGVTQAAPEAVGFTMGTALVSAGTNALSYVQKLATSDFGNLIIKKDGTWDYIPFSRRITGTIKGRIGEDTTRPIHLATVQYGTEYLYNKIRITLADGGAEAIVEDTGSIAQYGTRELQDTGNLLVKLSPIPTAAAEIKAQEVLELYSQPELRIDSVQLKLHDYSPADKAFVLGLELGDNLIVAFDPDNSGNKILRIVQIISIEHSVNVQEHVLTMNFISSTSTPFTLGDPDLGRLDAGNFLQRTWDFSI